MHAEYAKDYGCGANIGISRRLACCWTTAAGRSSCSTACSVRLPAAWMYYGDEIGMGDNIYLGDRDGVRTLMQWTGDRNAGFSKADPAALYLPFLMDPVYGYQAQRRGPGAGLDLAAAVGAAHAPGAQAAPGVRDRRLRAAVPRQPAGAGLLPPARDDVVLVVANLSRFAQPVELDLSCSTAWSSRRCSAGPIPGDRRRVLRLGLGPHGFYWFHLVEPPAETEDTAMFRAIRTWP